MNHLDSVTTAASGEGPVGCKLYLCKPVLVVQQKKTKYFFAPQRVGAMAASWHRDDDPKRLKFVSFWNFEQVSEDCRKDLHATVRRLPEKSNQPTLITYRYDRNISCEKYISRNKVTQQDGNCQVALRLADLRISVNEHF